MSPSIQGRTRWLWIYVGLLAASAATQAILLPDPVPGPGEQAVAVAPQTAQGPVSGAPVRIAYSEVGTGDAVILLHGSPGAIADYRHLLPYLEDRFHVVIPDLPGFGKSSRWLPDYSIAAHARYVLALMDARGIQKAHLVGFSMGGGVALSAADIAPERVSSVVLCGGIGVQEAEGSGDYYFEHAKYGALYAGVVVAPELVPHFGLLGRRSFRHTFARNFWDTDQRPLRETLCHLRQPLLILHGRHDPLVPACAAEEHHRLVSQSELVMFDDNHFMLLTAEGSQHLAEEMVPFLERNRDPDAASTPRMVDYTAGRPQPAQMPIPMPGAWAQAAALTGGTLLSEDLTAVSAGLLVQAGQMDLGLAVLSCFVGIFVGDLVLWAIGRYFGRRALAWPWVRRALPADRLERTQDWLQKRGWSAILISRFVPGLRLPVYLAAGVLGRNATWFIFWSFLAVLIWTPLLVIGAALFGMAVVEPLHQLVRYGWLALLLAGAGGLVLLRLLAAMADPFFVPKLRARLGRLYRWEFWPAWLFYLPLIPWLAYLSVRYRGVLTWTCANPGVPDGGVVGEAKFDILARLAPTAIVPSAVIEPGELSQRVEQLRQAIESGGWTFPLILKPNAGQRGAGVKRVNDGADAEKYLQANPVAVLAQTYHPGPFEAGVFYYRIPGEATGHIFSITDKRFPVVTGDGRSTLEQLIWRHPRYRMQAGTFLTRHANEKGRVLAANEEFRLALAGNHCQGTLFCDGAALLTPELERAVDAIVQPFDGFFIGRFDIRYSDVAEFRAGRGLAVVELNGVTSESSNLYDPSWSLLAAYRTLFRQWALIYRIGDENRRRGHRPSGVVALLGSIWRFYRERRVDLLSD
jgi:pimeloyl-ACP methyl ester carboxylesterase/membrane protein DedA with SNARE-associated domain